MQYNGNAMQCWSCIQNFRTCLYSELLLRLTPGNLTPAFMDPTVHQPGVQLFEATVSVHDAYSH